ncbi:hypothetical protein BZA77DRAFT_325221 [Pyronema omphalodes]|nr:hypothetical protein BZA77DRAFT_325221 [Pyronema omphalodes]
MDKNSDSLTEPLLPASPVTATPEPASEADESYEMPPTVSSKSSKSARIFRIAATFLVFVFIIVGLTQSLRTLLILDSDDLDIRTVLLRWGLPMTTYSHTIYPGDFTRDIQPLPIHSHNDYWRRVPFYSALAAGATSVEADVWLFPENGELYVGHDKSSLSRNRTLAGLYIEPIAKLLAERNSALQIGVEEKEEGMRGKRGIWDTQPSQTLHLYIDIKTQGEVTLPAVIHHLEPLRQHGYLTTWNGTNLIRGVVTVHLTGDTPFDLMLSASGGSEGIRDYFYDSPVTELRTGKYNISNSLMSTANFKKEIGNVVWGSGGMSESMKEKVKGHIKEAHERGIGVRYWDTPYWPISTRDQVWGQLVACGVDLLNVDDLKGAASGKW